MRLSYSAQAFVFLLAIVGLVAPALAGSDREAVERAVLDYVEAIEQGTPELIERGVHTELHKFGFYRQSPDAEYKIYPMTFDELRELAATYKEQGRVPDDPQHSIEILDVLDQTASVKLTAFWGIDYMHLAKYDGQWKVVQVLWQSHPPE
jgi:hypothetical protein